MTAADWAEAERRQGRTAALMMPPEGLPAVVIVPHHTPAADLIMAGIDAALDRWPAEPARVILLAPDHRHVATQPAMTSDLDWLTVRGRVVADRSAILDITRAPVVGSQRAIAMEHGLGTVMPVLADRLPGVPVVPLAVRSDVNAAEVRALTGALSPWTEGALIVAAVDFSHGLDLRSAGRADRESLAALSRVDGAAFLDWGSEHSDGAGALPLALRLARGLGADRFELGARSNSHRIGGPPTEVTTYVVGFVSSASTSPALRTVSSAVRTSPSR
jgi:AmmeMemoRadiSam system protein B